MLIVPNEYCNECKKETDLVVTGKDEHSIFAECPHCKAKFDLINDEKRVKEVKKVNVADKKHKAIQMYCHLRRHLSPMESMVFIKDRITDCPLDMGQLESARANKMLMAKRNGKINNYSYTY